jgi:hypothetical protein
MSVLLLYGVSLLCSYLYERKGIELNIYVVLISKLMEERGLLRFNEPRTFFFKDKQLCFY